ncbi:hypothetical protein IVA80_20120 [Bradyrhizobium sp. 139]|uniref:hypothetical protein n=1 Tax=Bradyrhizobium sp. 139 TaxID=2782616 RepID=UPI001FF8D5C8|nr:hypothetical protein [Bradyrhizobium sp. 139]MCK1743110.1 hypothetical protein [Bradyrhizobium sp. 139]
MYEVRNRFLRLLPPDELKHVLLLSEEVPLMKRQVLHRYGVRMQHVYFIESGLVSVGAKVGPEDFVEVWLIGSEGLAGIHLALTAKTQPMHRRIVQVPARLIASPWIAFRRRLLVCRLSAVWCTPISLPCSLRPPNQGHVIRPINYSSALGEAPARAQGPGI